MSRAALSIALLFLAQIAPAADLPPGVVARLGDDRFHAGSEIEHIALSPDGKQFATIQSSNRGTVVFRLWNAETGNPIREEEINADLFKGFTWGSSGGFAIVVRAELGTKDEPAKLIPDDFRVWHFTDPKAAPPSLLPAVQVGLSGYLKQVEAKRTRSGSEYTDFRFSADGKYVAARRQTNEKHTIHVFELKPTATAARLTRTGAINLGAEGADDICLSSDGKTVVAFRELISDREMARTATAWDVATGKPSPAVCVPHGQRFMVAPDARSLVTFFSDGREWGFDHCDITNGRRRPLTRWRYEPTDTESPSDWGGFVFSPSGHELIVVNGEKTYVVDIVKGREIGRLEGHVVLPFDGNPIVTAVSADGTRIVTADSSGLVRLWDAKTLRPLHDAPGHRAPVTHVELSPDGKRLLTWAPDKTVRLWDIATGKELRAFTGAPGPQGPGEPQHEGRPAFTPDGTSAFYCTKDRLIARDLQTGLETPLPGDMKALPSRGVVFAPDGKSVLTWVDAASRRFTVWDWPNGKKRFEIEYSITAAIGVPGFSPDNSVVFADSAHPARWDATTGKRLPPAWEEEFANQAEDLRSLRMNPRWLINNTKDTPRVIEAGSGKAVPGFQLTYTDDGNQRVTGLDLALSPTGGHFAARHLQRLNATLVCETVTGNVRRTLQGHRGDARVLGFTPDGTKLLTAGGDHTVLVWDMRLQSVPLPDALKKETSAAKLWDTLASGKADAAYLAMARLAREPEAAVKIVRMRLKPAARENRETDESRITDCRAIELLAALNTDSSRALLKELAAGHAGAFRTQEAKRAIERNKP